MAKLTGTLYENPNAFQHPSQA